MHLVEREVDTFLARQHNPGPYYRQAAEAVETGTFYGVTLQKDPRVKPVDPQKFYEALAESVRSRMVTESEKSLFDKINVLVPETWPSPLPVFYGEDEIRELCDLFDISFSGVRQRFRDFKEHPEIPVTDGLLKLQQAVKSLAVSSADCERGFSEMNITITPLRAQLKIQKVSALMFISLVGPPVNQWNPQKYVKKWVLTRRAADHTACPQRKPVQIKSQYQSIWEQF